MDLDRLEAGTGDPLDPLREISDALDNFCTPVRPVIRPRADPTLLPGLRHAAELNGGHWIARLGRDGGDPAGSDVEALAADTGLFIEGCDLIIELREIMSADGLRHAESVVRAVGHWVRRYSWNSVTVAAGSMPASISKLPKNQPTLLQRHEATLRLRTRDLGYQFGDYGIGHPRPLPPAGGHPIPSLRYTADEGWWIYRWAKHGKGYDSFGDLCATLMSNDHWPPEGAGFSWGDAELAERTRGDRGFGDATKWIAWGTSHHLAFILSRL
ncbi:hypothetical protein J3R03_000100 [Actinoplanes couchii]|nr:hypothetical protein [Actinoplanes couchii]